MSRTTPTRDRLVVTERDRRLLEYTYRFRLLSRDQLMALTSFGSLTRANTRLGALSKARLVSRKLLPITPGNGSAQTRYYLGPASINFLNADPAVITAQIRQISRWDMRQVGHVMAANQVLVDFLSAAEQLPDVQPISFQTEPELRRLFVGRSLVPDGWIAWVQQGKRFNGFIEVDLGHEGLHQWRRKVLDYVAYAASGVHQELFSFRSFRVLVLAQTTRRLDNLRRSSEHAEGLFSFAQLGHVTAKNMLSAVWLPTTGRSAIGLTEVS